MRSTVFLMFAVIAAGFGSMEAAFAQEDPVEMAKMYPPRLLKERDNETNLAAINWRLQLTVDLKNRIQQERDSAVVAMEVYSKKLDELNNQLPVEVRFVDNSVHSRLIGKTMEELLDARLSLATRQSSVRQLESMLAEEKDSKQARLVQQQSAMAIEAAKLKLRVAESEYEKSAKLAAKGYMTESNRMVAQYTLAIAKQELESVVLKAEVDSEQQNAEIAERLTDARIEIEPIKARVVAAEKFLKTFVDSSKISTEIEETKRAWERAKDDLRESDSEM